MDLVCFDDYDLALNVASSASGTYRRGHDKDYHVIDMVAGIISRPPRLWPIFS